MVGKYVKRVVPTKKLSKIANFSIFLFWRFSHNFPKNRYKYPPFKYKSRDIVVGLFRLAGLEEDEDLLYACTMDVRCLMLLALSISCARIFQDLRNVWIFFLFSGHRSMVMETETSRKRNLWRMRWRASSSMTSLTNRPTDDQPMFEHCDTIKKIKVCVVVRFCGVWFQRMIISFDQGIYRRRNINYIWG